MGKSSRAPENKIVKRMTAASKSRKPRTYDSRTSKRQHRLSLGGNTRSQKTLTQIDFVRNSAAAAAREIVPESELEYIDTDKDEDVDLSPKKREHTQQEPERRYMTRSRSTKINPSGLEPITEEPSDMNMNISDELGYSELGGARKKRKLSNDGDSRGSQISKSIVTTNAAAEASISRGDSDKRCENTTCTSNLPVTPRKPVRLVVPSSQSPDSPEISLETPHIHKSPLRSPLSRVSSNVGARSYPKSNENCSPSRHKILNLLQKPGATPDSSITNSRSKTPDQSVLKKETPDTSPSPADAHGHIPQSGIDATQTKEDYQNLNNDGLEHCPDEEDVIYGTDTELDKHSNISEADGGNNKENQYHVSSRTIRPGHAVNIPTQSSDSSPSLQLHDTLRTIGMGAENSIMYWRKPMNTLWDPTNAELRDIGPEKMAELFPDYEACQEQHDDGEPSLPAPPENKQSGQTQTSAKDPIDISTEFVPDSSQAQQQRGVETFEDNDQNVSSQPIVLVQSSQDNNDKTNTASLDSPNSQTLPRHMLTESQLLTDSLMESIPGPPIWMLSQGQRILREDEEENDH